MTMQIGIIGPTGIVVASDRKLSYFGGETNQAATTEKIIWNADKSILCAFAGYRTANAIAAKITDLDVANFPLNSSDYLWKQGLHRAASEVSRPSVLNPLDEIIVVRRDCLDKFWLVGKQTGTAESVDIVLDRLCTGDTGSLGRFWPHFFYKASASIDEMKFMAVLTIWWREKHNSTGIGHGIDLVICTQAGIEVQTDVEVLIKRCGDLYETLRSNLNAVG
jgi:hypothetical protein